MSQIADNVGGDRFASTDDDAIETRLFRLMTASVGIAVVASMIVTPWRITTGLIVGGSLSLLNYHWLRTSIAAIFSDVATQRPRLKASRYILRYFIVGGVAFAGYKLRLVSLPATIAGLCAFVPALFVEAGRQFYFAIIHREESF